MQHWAEKQARTEMMTTPAALVMAVILVLAVFAGLTAREGIVQRNRVVDVPDAAAAERALTEGRVARVSYEGGQYLGSVTVQTTTQGEYTFMMGGTVGAVPGRTRIDQTDYDLWGMRSGDFDALCFFPAGMEVPESGTLTMDTQIEWVTSDERAQLIGEAGSGEVPAFLHLHWTEEAWRWPLVAGLVGLTLAAVLVLTWLLKSGRALRLTKFWKKLARAGQAEEIFRDLQDTLYEDGAFAIGHRYVCLAACAMPREGLAVEPEEDGLRFTAANGQSAVYYPDDEASAARVRQILNLK